MKTTLTNHARSSVNKGPKKTVMPQGSRTRIHPINVTEGENFRALEDSDIRLLEDGFKRLLQ